MMKCFIIGRRDRIVVCLSFVCLCFHLVTLPGSVFLESQYRGKEFKMGRVYLKYTYAYYMLLLPWISMDLSCCWRPLSYSCKLRLFCWFV